MAKILDRDPISYVRERDSFLHDLQHFHETKGTPFRRSPHVNGHEIDLYLLYILVTSQGGWIKVNARNEWPNLYTTFSIPENCVNAGVALKQLYLRYLDRWEKVHFLGEEHERGGDDDEESRHRRWSARALHSVPLNYNHIQHNISDASREYNNLSTNLYKPSDYDRLVLSLVSPLPNEQDFAVNVCTLLSNDGKHTLKLDKYPRIIDHLVAHAGVFNHSSLRKLFTNYYNKIRQHPLDNFWKDVLECEEFLDLSDENNFTKSRTSSPTKSNYSDSVYSILSSTLIKSDLLTDCNPETSNCFNASSNNSELISDSDNILNREIFNVGRTVGTQDYIGQRVLQIATIFRNLSFIEENIIVLAQNETFIRFMLLCSNARWGYLHTLGLDMLGNIVGQYEIKDLYSHRLSQCLMKLISVGLQSEDRTYCIASLDALNKLSQTEINEEVLARSLEPYIYQKVCSFLTLHDVMLLVYTLECLYSLSSLGERPCNLIVNIHSVLDTLVSLVTVEGKSYGPKACIGMKLVETVPAGSNNAATCATESTTATSTATDNSTATTTSSITATTTTTTTTIISSSNTTTSAIVTSSPTSISTSAVPTTPVKTTVCTTVARPVQRVIVTPASSVITSVTTASATMSPQQLVQQQHAHQQAIQENEQFALAWLRATYEPCHKNRIDHQELYKYYINSCAKIGRRGVIAPLHFPRCVRSVFGGTVGPNPMKSTNANEVQYYEGIKVRAQPLVIAIQPVSNLSTILSPAKSNDTRRKIQSIISNPASTCSSISLNLDCTDSLPPSPASPILKAQLSAPSKSRETSVVVSPTSKADIKSQVMAHPHLSQALLGSSNTATSAGPSKEPLTGQSNTSLIKSLLATKVNDCMPPISMKTSMDCHTVVQVAARQHQQQQQKLLSQQSINSKQSKLVDMSKTARLNGVRQLFVDDITDSSVSSTTVGSSFGTCKREPPQPPPPPLAPLSNQNRLTSRIDNEDSNSTGNNSLASSSGINLGISSTDDNDNSLTSFEGLLNGVPNIDNQLLLNDDSNSKDSLRSIGTSVICRNKPLMLADLLEKKVDKDPPILNGMLGKELRIGERGLELVENHIEKALNLEKTIRKQEEIDLNAIKRGIKRIASDDIDQEIYAKKTCISTNVNGSADSPRPDSVSSSSNCDEPTGTVSTAAAKLFADIAADILEDEEEEMLQEAHAQQVAENTGVVQVIQNNTMPQVFVDQPQQVLVAAAQPRQIIVSPSIQTTNPVVLPAGTQIKPGQTVIVQNPTQQRAPMVLQQSNTGQFVLSQGLPSQMQLVASTTQPGQYVLQTSTAQNAYVVAQSQTAVVHGQPQTVLVAQTTQQQGPGTKTIIILQQPASSTPTHHQKVVVTPQGQQVVVTQVPRPILQTASTVNNVIHTNPSVIRAPITTVINQTEKKPPDELKPVTRVKIIRDVNWPFICEWGDCQNDTKFKSANQVYLHVCEEHCMEGVEELSCQWDRCDNMKRKRFSMMTHVYDRHCNVEAMKQSQIKRKQTQNGKSDPPTSTTVATPHPGYAPDAALHAIKRHALEFVNPKELQDDNEGPVTKSLRLTAALILRNLVIYSNNCKRYLRQYEPHLANIALSNVESSRTVAQILYDMNEGANNR